MRRYRCVFFLMIAATGLFLDTNWATAQSLNENFWPKTQLNWRRKPAPKATLFEAQSSFIRGTSIAQNATVPQSEKDRIGPDLSRIDPKVTDEFIIQSLLEPSKQIKEGFETIVVLTVDGQTINGIKVSEDESSMVIRESEDVDKLITIDRDNLEGIRDGTKSSMPDQLANELKNRQQFLDLLRYVFDIKERGPEGHFRSVPNETQRELSPELEGLALTQKLNCAACHDTETLLSPIAAKQAPRLKWSAKNLNPHYIQSFIANPHQTKPATSMPEMLGHLDEATCEQAATAITQYLLKETGNEFDFQPIDALAVAGGFKLFNSVGCVACHSPRDRLAVEQPLADSAPLGDLAGKYNINGLTEFLEDPLAIRPSGHMPNMQLTHREAVEISNFLLQSSNPTTKWAIDGKLASEGETLFKTLKCANLPY